MSKMRSEFQSHPYGQAVSDLVQCFSRLPGIGRKSAERLTHYILACPEAEALQLSGAIRRVKQAVHPCTRCFNLTEEDVCSICSDPRRDQQVLCLVEQPSDVIKLEASNVFRGMYHVLQGRLSPLEGVGPDDLTIDALVQRVKTQGVTEIVMATNPTLEGDGTALFVSNLLAEHGVKITRLARGIASGSVLEYANKEMLADAMLGRQQF